VLLKILVKVNIMGRKATLPFFLLFNHFQGSGVNFGSKISPWCHFDMEVVYILVKVNKKK